MCVIIRGHVEMLGGAWVEGIPTRSMAGGADENSTCTCNLDEEGEAGDKLRATVCRQVVEPLLKALSATADCRIVIEFE